MVMNCNDHNKSLWIFTCDVENILIDIPQRTSPFPVQGDVDKHEPLSVVRSPADEKSDNHGH
jgi:hypothetical protein